MVRAYLPGVAVGSGMEYRANHNSPQVGEESLASRMMKRWRPVGKVPECVHMGFAASMEDRQAKHRYYEARGEGKETAGKNRSEYVACRRAWETWYPGAKMPRGCGVVLYRGPVPECFLPPPVRPASPSPAEEVAGG